MKLKAYAKINLSLDLTGILPDGYHAINTVMQSVSLYDTVNVNLRTDGVINLGCSEKNVPIDNKNTAYKAAEYFFEEVHSDMGADIYIEKNIPSQAGLAGGSADAAAVIYALNIMYKEISGKSVSPEKLFEIALRVGADVPFCLAGGTRLCLNKGEVMTKLPDFNAFVLLAKPERGVSTGSAFRRFDTAEKLLHPENEKVLEFYKNGKGENAAPFSLNIFEQLCDILEGDKIKNIMLENGAYYASMSGSGSCFFGLFEKEVNITKMQSELNEFLPFTYFCHTVAGGVEEIKE